MYLVVGCGLSGAVIARQIAEVSLFIIRKAYEVPPNEVPPTSEMSAFMFLVLGERVLVVEKRDHIGGNCYDYEDPETGILLNKYGAHLFHTESQRVWDYVNRFDTWKRWEHRVVSMVEGALVPVPVNITTVNALCGTHLRSPDEMRDWLANNQEHFPEIRNSEEMALSRVGRDLYEKMFKPYTLKQWNKSPAELDPSVLARIPVRGDFDVRYFSDRYQALPAKGYTHFFTKLLDHPNIEAGVDYLSMEKGEWGGVIYTGPIDDYFHGVEGRLEYRSIHFRLQRHLHTPFFQPNSVVNYPGLDVDHTRIVEYKHFLDQTSPHTLVVYETTNDDGEPFYPVPNQRNLQLYAKYQKMAEEAEARDRVYFLGRLANYKYFNMDEAILNALVFFDRTFAPHSSNHTRPYQ